MDVSSQVGIIARSVREIFDRLQQSSLKFSVSVSHLYIYNENLTDLLASSEVEMRLMEDPDLGVRVVNLSETLVRYPEEISDILRKSRKVRSLFVTLRGIAHSRSHQVFSITVRMNETNPEGEVSTRMGKLDFFDLAASDLASIRRDSFSHVNKSLITLNRVTEALGEEKAHIPYRDSKLTRLLQSALGGRCKACMIATISPDLQVLEDTLKTLKYATMVRKLHRGPKLRLPRFDLSDLINCASLPQDLDLSHEGFVWNVSSEILVDLQPSLDLKRLGRVIASSRFPHASIDAFISFLHQKHLPLDNKDHSAQIWSHTAHLWRAIGLFESSGPLVDFASTFVPLLPAAEACRVLVELWNDPSTNWTSEDLIIEILTAHVKEVCFETFKHFVASQATYKNTFLAMHVAAYLKSNSKTKVSPSPTLGLNEVITEFVKLDPSTPTKSLLTRPMDFAFALSHPMDQSLVILADMRHMFVKWRWFRRMMDVGNCLEKTSRVAVMPSHMRPNMLLAILECVQATSKISLEKKEAFALLMYRREFDLTDFEDRPFPPFQSLIAYCTSLSRAS